MEDEDVIRAQMNDTRTAMKDKLGTLESKVVTTVQDATSAVNETVSTVKDTLHEAKNAVTDTVATVKDTISDTVSSVTGTVQDTVTAVKDTMGDGVDAVKNLFDVNAQVKQRPWAVVGGSVALGFLLGRLLSPKSAERRESRDTPSRHEEPSYRTSFASEPPAKEEKAGWFDALGPEIDKLKGLALGAAMGTVQEMVMQAVPPQVGGHLKEIIENVTKKLGGEPVSMGDSDADPDRPANGKTNEPDFETSSSKKRHGNHRDPVRGGYQK